MFQNESYSQDRNSSFTHVHNLNSIFIRVHEDIGTLAYFSLQTGGSVAALAHLTPLLTIHVAFGHSHYYVFGPYYRDWTKFYVCLSRSNTTVI